MRHKTISNLVTFALVLSIVFAVSAMMGISSMYNVSAGTATENIGEIIEDLEPSFVLLVFVMVFMLMLMVIVDRLERSRMLKEASE